MGLHVTSRGGSSGGRMVSLTAWMREMNQGSSSAGVCSRAKWISALAVWVPVPTLDAKETGFWNGSRIGNNLNRFGLVAALVSPADGWLQMAGIGPLAGDHHARTTSGANSASTIPKE